MNVKPIALLTVVADNGMIGNVDDSPLPFDFESGMGWMLHLESGKDSKDAAEDQFLKHNLVYGRRVYEEFAGYGVLPSGGGTNFVVSGSMANKDGSPKPLPTVLGDDSTIDPRLVAVGSVEQALELGTKVEADTKDGEMCLVLGGQRVYTDALPKATFLRKFHMRTDFEGGIRFPDHKEEDWKPIYKSKPLVETNKVDGKDVELQVIEYVNSAKADDATLAPAIDSIKKVNLAFDMMEPLEE